MLKISKKSLMMSSLSPILAESFYLTHALKFGALVEPCGTIESCYAIKAAVT